MHDIKALKDRLKKNLLTRREFIKLSAALGFAAAPGTFLMGSTAAAAPKKGGHIRVATVQGSSSDLLDPTLWGRLIR